MVNQMENLVESRILGDSKTLIGLQQSRNIISLLWTGSKALPSSAASLHSKLSSYLKNNSHIPLNSSTQFQTQGCIHVNMSNITNLHFHLSLPKTIFIYFYLL